MWSKQSLKNIIKENFEDYQFLIVSNREPFIHIFKDNKIVSNRSVGGVTVSLDTIMQAAKGTWIAYGGSSADRKVVDQHDRIKVPPHNHKYTLRRIWMTEDELNRYYKGFSNSTLWPLCHAVFIRPTFDEIDWAIYKKINKHFAQAVLEEIDSNKAIVWVQDYHLALLPKYIKEKRPDVLVGHFWHIPWPSQEIFRICPWKKDILDGLLHNDLLGFHRYYHAENFFKTLEREMEVRIDREDQTISYKNKVRKVGIYPISVDYEYIVDRTTKIDQEAVNFFREAINCPYEILAVGVDRIDYTKGIIQRLQAIDIFLENYPKYKGKFVYLGIGAPSRTDIETYRELGNKISDLVNKINQKYKKRDWQPIHYINEVVERSKILYVLSQANLCFITSLDDGMNLVAKEFIAANQVDGSLILSEFTGAAKELTESYLINPYDVKGVAQAIYRAVTAPHAERQKRMNKMKEIVKERNIYRWAGKFLLELSKLK